MMEFWNNLCNMLLDPVLLPVLRANWTLTLFIVALGTALILTLVRKWTSNQELLHRAQADKRVLKGLIREAKVRRDKASVKRHKLTINMIGMKTLSQEGLPLAVSLLPIAILATWCYARLEFHPPRDNEPVTVAISTPAWAIGEPVHIVPVAGLRADDGTWVRQVKADPAQPATGTATWQLVGKAATQPYDLQFRLRRAEGVACKLLVGQAVYAAPLEEHAGEFQTHLEMRPARLFGVVPGVGSFLPAWLVAYLLIAVPATFLFRRVFHVA